MIPDAVTVGRGDGEKLRNNHFVDVILRVSVSPCPRVVVVFVPVPKWWNW